MGYGGLALRFVATTLRVVEFCASIIILGIYAYYLAVLSEKKLQIPKWERAVEGISGAGALYTLFGIILTFCLGGLRVFGALATLLDVLFTGAFIVIAWYTRHGAGKCTGTVNTPLGSAPSNESAPGAGHYGYVCRLNTACFAVAVLNIFLFLVSAVWQTFLVRHHIKEKRYGPGPSNDYTSGTSRPPFWRRGKAAAAQNTRDAELATAQAGNYVSHEANAALNGGHVPTSKATNY